MLMVAMQNLGNDNQFIYSIYQLYPNRKLLYYYIMMGLDGDEQAATASYTTSYA